MINDIANIIRAEIREAAQYLMFLPVMFNLAIFAIAFGNFMVRWTFGLALTSSACWLTFGVMLTSFGNLLLIIAAVICRRD